VSKTSVPASWSAALSRYATTLGTTFAIKAARGRNLRMVVREREVQLSIPRYVSAIKAAHFVEANLGWLRQQLNTQQKSVHAAANRFRLELNDHDQIVMWDQDIRVCFGVKDLRGSWELRDQALCLKLELAKATPSKLSRLLHNACAETLHREALSRVKHWSEFFGVRIKQMQIKNMRTRWGSMSSDHRMSLSFALIFAPKSCLDYVVAHELAHIKEHNHSAAFWAHVARAIPNYETPHRWLQTHHTELQQMTQSLAQSGEHLINEESE
jgi:predicted metal-dependent hydrolase